MTQRITKKLQELLNKPCSYGTKQVTITGYDFNEEKERVYIHTSEKENAYDRPYDSCYQFLREFTIIESAVAISSTPLEPKQTDAMLTSAQGLANRVQEILLDNISKIQQDPEYITQAKAINNNVNSLINLNKLTLTAMLTAKKLNAD